MHIIQLFMKITPTYQIVGDLIILNQFMLLIIMLEIGHILITKKVLDQNTFGKNLNLSQGRFFLQKKKKSFG